MVLNYRQATIVSIICGGGGVIILIASHASQKQKVEITTIFLSAFLRNGIKALSFYPQFALLFVKDDL